MTTLDRQLSRLQPAKELPWKLGKYLVPGVPLLREIVLFGCISM